MMASPWRAAILVCCAACASGTPQSAPAPAAEPAPYRPTVDPLKGEPVRELVFRYPTSGGGIARYALTRRDSVNATMPTGDVQIQVLGRTAYVTVTWVAADSGARLTAQVDSVVGDSGLLAFSASLDSARGARWNGFRRPAGQLRELDGGPRSLVGDQVRDQLALLFPALPAAGARPGMTWIDSTSGPARVSAFEATENARIDSRAESQVTSAGALPLVVVRTRNATGQGTQFGQPMALRATGSDSLTYQLAPDGRVLSVEGTRITDLVVDLPSIGQSVPAHERSSLRMSLLR
jgi:hypothetical protein